MVELGSCLGLACGKPSVFPGNNHNSYSVRHPVMEGSNQIVYTSVCVFPSDMSGYETTQIMGTTVTATTVTATVGPVGTSVTTKSARISTQAVNFRGCFCPLRTARKL